MNRQKKGLYEGETSYSVAGGRKGFLRNGEISCKSCFELSLEIDRLRVENRQLKDSLKHRNLQLSEVKVQRKEIANAHTPSSQRRYKKNSTQENQTKVGGALPGHLGHGRETIAPDQAEEKILLPLLKRCPRCEVELEPRDARNRSVLEAQPFRSKKVIYRCPRGVCPKCLRTWSTGPTAIPRSLYGNSLLAQAAALHFFHGMTLGKVRSLLGEEVSEGGLIHAFHRLGTLCEKARASLIEDYRLAKAKHADETGWRTDGQSGYAWLFCTSQTSIFEFRETRAARVPKEILGDKSLPGVLIVDRYGGYNRMPCALQYCYAHLLREVERLGDEFPDSKEAEKFVGELATELTLAMKLRTRELELEEYRKKASEIQQRIHQIVSRKAVHLGVRRIQCLFQDKRERLYPWVKDPEIPPENNRAERELRPTVIARKISLGSQSRRGALTRSRIMSVLWTAKKRFPDRSVEQWLTHALQQITLNPHLSFADLLQIPSTSTH